MLVFYTCDLELANYFLIFYCVDLTRLLNRIEVHLTSYNASIIKSL